MNRKLYFDGLRGVMALIVAFGHFFGQVKILFLSAHMNELPGCVSLFYKMVETTPLVFLINGNFATTVFFVLSGCVLFEAFNANSTFVGALIRRYLRLMLPVFFSCLIGYIMLSFDIRDDYSGLHDLNDLIDQGITTLYTSSFTTKFINPVIWSMPTEFIGSIILLIVSLYMRNDFNRGVQLLFVITAFCYGYYIFFMLAGAWLYLIFYKSTQLISYEIGLKKSLVIVGAIIILQSCPVYFPWGSLFVPNEMFVKPLINLNEFSIAGMYSFHSYEFIRGVGGVLLVVLVLLNSWLRSFLSSKIIQFFGRISFSLYLIHWLILSSLVVPVNNALYSMFHSITISYVFSFIVYAVVTILCSLVFYSIVEVRSINFSRFAGKYVDGWIMTKGAKS